MMRFVACAALVVCCSLPASAERFAYGVEAEAPPAWQVTPPRMRPRKLALYGDPDHDWKVDVIAQYQAQAGCFVTVSRARIGQQMMPVSLVEEDDWAGFCEEKGCGLAPWSAAEQNESKQEHIVGNQDGSDWNRELLREVVRERVTSAHRLVDVTVVHATTRRATRGGAKGAGASGVSVVVVMSCPEKATAPLADLDRFLASVRVSTPSAMGPVVTSGKDAIPPQR
jgi:hypothetical protein